MQNFVILGYPNEKKNRFSIFDLDEKKCIDDVPKSNDISKNPIQLGQQYFLYDILYDFNTRICVNMKKKTF